MSRQTLSKDINNTIWILNMPNQLHSDALNCWSDGPINDFFRCPHHFLLLSPIIKPIHPSKKTPQRSPLQTGSRRSQLGKTRLIWDNFDSKKANQNFVRDGETHQCNREILHTTKHKSQLKDVTSVTTRSKKEVFNHGTRTAFRKQEQIRSFGRRRQMIKEVQETFGRWKGGTTVRPVTECSQMIERTRTDQQYERTNIRKRIEHSFP